MLGRFQRGHLLQLTMKIEELGIPFIIGGDFQCSPYDPMIQAWADAIDATIVAPKQTTCRTEKLEGSTIDFFVVHKDLAHHVRDVQLEEVESNPHVPVRLTLDTNVRQQWEYVAKKPKNFPETPVYGPKRFPMPE